MVADPWKGSPTAGWQHLLRLAVERPRKVKDRIDWWNHRLHKPCFVYVIQALSGGPIKIGKAKDPIARMRGLQTGNPEQLCIVAVVPGEGDLEVHLHAMLDQWRIYGSEWFDGDGIPGALDYIRNLSDKMLATDSPFGEAPHWTEIDPVKYRRVRKRRKPAPVTVRFTEPDPVVPPDEAQRMRDSVRGCTRSAWMGPATGPARQRISPSRGFGN